MIVTYQRIEVQSYNIHRRVRHEQVNQLLGTFFLYSPSSLHTKAKFVKNIWSRTIASTWRKQMFITYVSLGLL